MLRTKLILLVLCALTVSVASSQKTYFKTIKPIESLVNSGRSLTIDNDYIHIASKVICSNSLDTVICLGVSKHDEFGELIWSDSYNWSGTVNSKGITVRNDSIFVVGHKYPGISNQYYTILILNNGGDSIFCEKIDMTNDLLGEIYSNGFVLSGKDIYIFGQTNETSDYTSIMRVVKFNILNATHEIYDFKTPFALYYPGWDMEEDSDGNLLIFNEIYGIEPRNTSVREILKITKEGEVLQRLYSEDTGKDTDIRNEFVLLDNGTYFFIDHVKAEFGGTQIPRLINMDTDGSVIWSYEFPFYNQFADEGRVRVSEVIKTINGDIVLTGWRQRSNELGKGYDIWLMRVSPDGDILWEKNYNTPDDLSENQYHYYFPTDVQEFADGSILVMAGSSHDDDITLLRVDANGCIDEYGCETDVLLDTSSPSIDIDNNVVLAPNPTQGVFTINLDQRLSGVYNTYNLAGELVDTKTFDSKESLSFDYSHLQSGLYNIVLSTDDGRIVKKVIID